MFKFIFIHINNYPFKIAEVSMLYLPGSILAVTIADPHAQGKTNRFVGICIERKGAGLRAEFTLRNVVDQQGVEVNRN